MRALPPSCACPVAAVKNSGTAGKAQPIAVNANKPGARVNDHKAALRALSEWLSNRAAPGVTEGCIMLSYL